MSFFDTEELHAVMPDKVADEGGRAALKGTPTSLHLEVCGGDGRLRPRSGVPRTSEPGSSGKSRLKAPAQFGAKKDIHIPGNNVVSELKQ